MNRRHFLKLLSATAPVAAAAPTYFFAPRGGWHQRAGRIYPSVDYGEHSPYLMFYFCARNGSIWTCGSSGFPTRLSQCVLEAPV